MTVNSQLQLNKSILLSEVQKAISSCKLNKSPGVDCIPNEVIKHPNVVNLLVKVYQYCFENGIVPKMWLRSLIKPIPKSSEKNPYLPLNYRGISLISCIGKVYSSILNSRLTLHLEENNVLVDEQNGFRKSRSCEDHTFVLSSIIDSRKSEGKATFAAFIDMSKVFDSINRNMLFYKLLHYVSNWYFKWQMMVNVDKTKIVHFRNKRKPRSKFEFKINETSIECIGSYQYLGIVFDAHLTFEKCAKA